MTQWAEHGIVFLSIIVIPRIPTAALVRLISMSDRHCSASFGCGSNQGLPLHTIQLHAPFASTLFFAARFLDNVLSDP